MRFRSYVALTLLIFASQLQAEPIKVGVIFGMTGPAAKWAEAQRKGILLALDEPESSGIQVIYEDSGSDPKQAISAFHKLTQSDGVDYIVGDVFSNITEALIPLVRGKKVVLVSPSTPRSTCKADIPNYFSISAQIPDSLPAWKRAFERLNIKRAGFVYFDNPTWGGLYRSAWGEAAGKAELVGEFKNTDITGTDFKMVLPKLLAKKPDTIFLAHDALGFFRAIQALKYEGRVVSANHLLEHILDPSVSGLLEGSYIVDSPVTPAFSAAFAEKSGHPPVLEPQTSYEAIRAISSAQAKGERSLDGVHYRGVAGEIDFRGSCAGNHAEWELFQVREGRVSEIN